MRQRTKEGGVILAQVGRYRLTRYDSLNLILERREDVRTREPGSRTLTDETREEWLGIGYYGKFLAAGERWLDLLMFDKLTDLPMKEAVAAFREESEALRHALVRATREHGPDGQK